MGQFLPPLLQIKRGAGGGELREEKMYTREEFEVLRRQWAEEMAKDKNLNAQAFDLLAKADHHNWIHQTTWFGEPVLQLPQDLFAMQEIIFKTRPDYIVEVGLCWGGSALFYATLMSVLGGKKIIGVDLYIPDDLRARLASHEILKDRLVLINGSSVEESTFSEVEKIVMGSDRVLVVLDSNHSHDHVLKELNLYSSLVGVGQYLVCCDTFIEIIPPQTHRQRPWGPGNSPMTAVQKFMEKNEHFVTDRALENKLLLTSHPRGYLRRVK